MTQSELIQSHNSTHHINLYHVDCPLCHKEAPQMTHAELALLPKVKYKVTDDNVFLVMGEFRRAARKAKWPENAIRAVLEECRKGDYNHLILTIDGYCK